MPDSRDYGHNDSKTLVPGSLRVFRHFQADLESGILLPMNYRPKPAGYWGPRDSAILTYQVGREVHRARCNRIYSWGDSVREHATPSVDCTCGFYASYDPDTDFYPAFRWGTKQDEYWYGPGSPESKISVLRAVCEVTGTTVMGRLGVRAQKIRVVALAVDWSKHEINRLRPIWDADPLKQARRVVFNPVTGEYEIRVFAATEEEVDERLKIEADAAALANAYGARFYSSVAEMHADHPKEDVEALGVDTNTPPPSKIIGAGYQFGKFFTQQQLTLMANQFQQATKALNETSEALKKALSTAYDIPVSVISDEPETTFEKAMRLKRNRPAPPGSGINRRKRKL